MSGEMFDMAADTNLNPNAGRDTAMGMFYVQAAIDEKESKIAGHPVYNDVVMVKIRIPGDKFNEPIHTATDEHKRRFPRSWEAFQKSKSHAIEGMPIEQWPPVTPAQVAMLKGADILSVEALSELNETKLPHIPDIMRLKQKARDWLKAASGTADATRLQGELREALERSARLEARMEQLQAALDAFKEPVKRGPGRPKRVVND